MFVNFNILNQLGSPAINSNTFVNRPAAGQTGRLFVSTDTFEIYRDNGTTWDLIGGPGTSTITGTGTATQVAYFTSSQAIGSDSNLFWDNANIRLGIGTSSPGARLDVHGSGVVGQFNGTTSASNIYLAFQRGGSNLWRVGDMYNSGQNFFEIRNSVLSNNAVEISAATNKTTFLANESYSSGQAQGNLFTYNLTAPAGATFTSPNAISAVNAFINLSLGGNATMPAGTRQGIEGNSRLSFTGAGTLTMSQGSTLRAYAAITGVHSFAGSAVGTITHLAGLRLCFPDNIGSAVSVTNNYGLLINDQSAGTGTITYTNRWGIYQEGASDLNYFAANMLLGNTVNNGNALQVTGTQNITGSLGIGTTSPAYKLSVLGSALANMISWTDNINNTGYLGIRSTAASIGADNNLVFETGATERMRITSTGNVGIGTTTPAYKLDVQNAGDFDTRIRSTNAGGTIGILFETANTFSGTSQAYIKGIGSGSSGLSDLIFGTAGTSGATTGTERMRITSGGNVGINTTTPTTYSLAGSHVENYGGSNYAFIHNNTATVKAFLASNESGLLTALYTYSNHPLTFGTNNTERARITSGGNVLIGTTTDAGQKLQVSGTARASEFNSTSGSVSVAPTTNTTFFTPTTVGLYMAHVYLGGNATATWDAVIIFAFNATDILVVNQTNGVNVSTQISGTNIQVRQIGGTTYTFDYQIIKIA